jgi:photosystem II stability/assembly factor-like uncharacterized protein
MKHTNTWSALIILLFVVSPSVAQIGSDRATFQEVIFNPGLYQNLNWRNIGPFRGGRSVAVAGVPGNSTVYYMGSTGGGVWKTEDAGISWKNLSDGFFRTGSVGAIAIAESDPNVIYVGMGEHAIRGVMTSYGDGVYKSTDGGKSWSYLGLPMSRHISSIRVHPEDPNLVYVAVQGAAYGPTKARGIYKSNDGGRTWRRSLFIDENTGACDLTMDVNNPRILYAGMWDHRRTPWQIRSGGPGSGIYKSTDGGENWEQLIDGLPQKMGKVAVSVSRANSNIVYANIEAESGGVFRSDDGGKNWVQTNNQRLTIARAWYYTEIVADPQDAETVYVLNAPLLKSIDGGKTFDRIENPHSDQHDLWINPNQPQNMILANDGGATITFNGGITWSSQKNQATGQFYRLITDNQFPYNIYSAQQDNTTVAIPSRTHHKGIAWEDWHTVAGGESAFITFDPDNPDPIYGTDYLGNISVYDHATRTKKDIMAYPNISMGTLPRDMKYRFNWNAPLISCPHNSNTLYHAANVVLKTIDGGFNWEEISPDLTRNDKSKQGPGGVPYTNEGAGGETYNTISYLNCSPHENGVIWAGTDDGLVHLTKDGGKKWMNVTPPELNESLINYIEVSPHDPKIAFIAATRYKFNDLKPYIYYTENYGKSWEKITSGIISSDFVRVIKEDPMRKGLLYAGTESGLYISFNNGEQWDRFQLNLPVCPVTDLTIHDNDLIAATSGRGIWILDDISSVQQSLGQLNGEAVLFAPKPAVRFKAETPDKPVAEMGQNPLNGLIIDYYLPAVPDENGLQLQILNGEQVIRSYSNEVDPNFKEYEGGPMADKILSSMKGINRFHWDLQRITLPSIPDVFVMGNYTGSLVAPGEYTIQLLYRGDTLQQKCTIIPDPRLKLSDQEYQAQQIVLLQIENAVKDIHLSVNRMRDVKGQIETLTDRLAKLDRTDELLEAGNDLVQKLAVWEENLIQPKQETYQDVINYPNKLSAELLDLKNRIDTHDPRITQGARDRLKDLLDEWHKHKIEMVRIIEEDVAIFNQQFRKSEIPVLIVPSTGGSGITSDGKE